MSRNLLAMIIALCLISTSFAGAEGLLPSLVDTIGMPMPSLGEALGRYPEEEIPGADGGYTEVFQGITETDFNTFSVYLSEKGAALADYQAVGSSFSASIQVEGKTISFIYDTQTLEARVTYPKGTYNEWLDYAKTQYESAVMQLDEGKAYEAWAILTSIPNYSEYRSAALYLEAHPELAAAAREAKLASFRTVGGYVTFGSYEQDNNTGNGQEPIEWLVLDYDAAKHRVLLLSRYGLDAKPFYTEYVGITWEKCTLRTWLNGEFMNHAFSKTEQSAILITAVDNSKSQCYSEWDGDNCKNTKDKIFLLSYSEANKYLGVTKMDIWEKPNNMKSKTSPTAYAMQAGAYTNHNEKTADGTAAGPWWLRSPGSFTSYYAATVSICGDLGSSKVNKDNNSVRPALWIDLHSDIF